METIDNRTFKEKVEAFAWNAKEKAKECWVKTFDWCSQNKELLIVGIPTVCATISKVSKNVNQMSERRYDYEERYKQVWDPATRQHVKLRRELRPSEQLELSQRNQEGERITDILFDMGVVKRR